MTLENWQEQLRDNGLRCSFTLQVEGEKAAVFTLEFAAEGDCHA